MNGERLDRNIEVCCHYSGIGMRNEILADILRQDYQTVPEVIAALIAGTETMDRLHREKFNDKI